MILGKERPGLSEAGRVSPERTTESKQFNNTVVCHANSILLQ